jgi:hypothetical protein
MNIARAGRRENGDPAFDPTVDAPRREGFKSILEWGMTTGEFRALNVSVTVTTIIEALDAIPSQLAAEPNLELTAYADALAELFDRATRSDAARKDSAP